MTSSTLVPVQNTNQTDLVSRYTSSNRYSIFDHGQGCRTYSYEFDLNNYQPEQIVVNLDKTGRLTIRASRSPCQEFKREYYLGGPNVDTRLIRNTIDPHGRLRVDVDVQPRQADILPNNSNILTFDLQGYRPKNVNIRINEHGLLKITAQHHDENFGNHIDREYYRQYQLPKWIRPDQIRAQMNENRILTIELPQTADTQKQARSPYTEKSNGYAASKRCCNVM